MDSNHKSKLKKSPMAGGIFIFVGLLAGSIIGIANGQPSLGMIAGFGIGAALAILLWLADSMRNKGK